MNDLQIEEVDLILKKSRVVSLDFRCPLLKICAILLFVYGCFGFYHAFWSEIEGMNYIGLAVFLCFLLVVYFSLLIDSLIRVEYKVKGSDRIALSEIYADSFEYDFKRGDGRVFITNSYFEDKKLLDFVNKDYVRATILQKMRNCLRDKLNVIHAKLSSLEWDLDEAKTYVEKEIVKKEIDFFTV